MPRSRVAARWKLAIVLEGSHAKLVRGLSDKPIHEFFRSQADVLLDATALIEVTTSTGESTRVKSSNANPNDVRGAT